MTNFNMKIKLIKSRIFEDERGLFFPLELKKRWLQSNVSTSKKWVFRGLHHQKGKTSQSKLISVIQGSIIDFVVDLRHGSFMNTGFFKLNAGDQIYVPRGCAHGFLSLEDNTIVQYLVDNDYSPSTEISIDWKSVELVKEIILAEIGDEKNLVISPKDAIGENISMEHVELIIQTKPNL